MSTTKQGRRRRQFTKDYQAEVVAMIRQSGKTAYALARELGLPAGSVRNWYAQAEADAGRGMGALTTKEREELARLRREVRVLRQERDVLKKATAFFAKEGQS